MQIAIQSAPLRPRPKARARICVAALTIVAAAASDASCGSAFCTLLNDRFALGTWDHVGWSADFRLEQVTQSKLRSGTRNPTPTELAAEEAIERHTRNLNLVTTIERSFDDRWSLALRVPLVRRDHLHDLVDANTGAIGPSERWRFTRVGDAQLLARWQDASRAPDLSWALTGGLELPSGSKRVTNADGSRAERALQPGSGTTDLVLGASLRQGFGGADALNLQVTVVHALEANEDFKRGRQIDVAAGWSHAYSAQLSASIQASASFKSRDSGLQSEPGNSGATALWLSPGATLSIDKQAAVYGFIQLPAYQKVNGIQLVPKASLVLGYTLSF
jgi:hypothetical protein